MRRNIQTLLLVVACSGLQVAAAQDLSPRFDRRGGSGTAADPLGLGGLWRVKGRDRRAGDFQGLVRFTAIPGTTEYTYERTLQGVTQPLGSIATSERGQAFLTGAHVYTKQEAGPRSPGMVSAFGGGQPLFRAPIRHAFYRLRGRQAPGFFVLPKSGQTGPERLTRVGGAGSDHVDLLVDGKEFFPLLRAELEGAQRSIEMQTFIYTGDSTGRQVGKLLIDRARAGVKVRLLVDRTGDQIGDKLKDDLRAAGVELIVQHGYGEGVKESFKGIWEGIKGLFSRKKKEAKEKRGIFNHDHRKITVVDDRVAFVGGMNIAHEYEAVWHDIHAKVQGPAVATLQEAFFDRWRAAGGEGEAPQANPELELTAPSLAVAQQAFTGGDMDVDVVLSLPGVSTDIKRRYLLEINKARRSIHIEMAYFLDDDVINALKRQAGRGIDSIVILPPDELHDVKIVRDAFTWVQNDVVRSGVQLYKYRDRMVHSKIASFDVERGTVGSSNLDNMAMTKLAEVNLFVNEPSFAKELEERIIEPDLPQSDRVEIEKLSWWQKIKGGTLHFLRSFL